LDYRDRHLDLIKQHEDELIPEAIVAHKKSGKGPNPTGYKLKNGKAISHTNHLIANVQTALMKVIAKTITVFNQVKTLYKNKISGLNLNRIEPSDFYKIKGILDPFFETSMELVENMKTLPRLMIGDNKSVVHVQSKVKEGIEKFFHQDFDQASIKFTKLAEDLNSVYEADCGRYFFNNGKI